MSEIQIKIISAEYPQDTEKEANKFLSTLDARNVVKIIPISLTSLLIQYNVEYGEAEIDFIK